MPLLQPPAPAPPRPPDAPAVEGGPGAFVFRPSEALTGVPRTRDDMAALRRRRSELSDQLTSAANRRSQLVRQLERMDPSARDGVQQRIQLLDQRLLQLEADIARTGQLVVAAPAELISTSESRPSFPVNNVRMNYTAIAIVFMIAVMMPIALAVSRMIWKRTTAATRPRPASTEDSQRLMRLEQAIDTIAVEVERVSEGQRFVTQLLADGAQPQMRALDRVPVAGRAER